VDAADFSLVSPPAGAGIATLIGVGGGTSYAVVVNTGTALTGTITLQLTNNGTIKDRTGTAITSPAANASFTGESFAINKGFPAVSSIVLGSPATTTAASVSWTVTFTQPVTGVDASDFALDVTGLSGAAITQFTAVNTTTWTVTASTGTGAGTLGLTLVDNDSIVNGTRKLGGSGAGNGTVKGPAYTVRGGCSTTTCSGPNTQDDNGSSGNNWSGWWNNWNNWNSNNNNNNNNNNQNNNNQN
jgi:MSHA biogenesis protein MshQ